MGALPTRDGGGNSTIAEIFANCSSLTAINVSENNINYCSVDGVLFTKDMKTLLAYPDGKTNTFYTIPSGVVNVDYTAFYDCNALTAVSIPESVGVIADYTFASAQDPNGDPGMLIIVPGFTIHGYAGSAAEDYARENGITFVDITPHTHSYISEITTAATCTSDGVRTFFCSCGYSYNEPINALGHTPGAWTVTKAASYKEKGLRQQKCTVCNAVTGTVELPMLVRTSVSIDETKSTAKVNESDKTISGIPVKTTVAEAVTLFDDPASVEIKNAKGEIIKAGDSKTMLGTGFTVSRVDKNGNVTDTLTVVIAGDADSDGAASSSDARLALRQSVSLENFKGAFLAACDIDGNGVSSSDARLILRFAVGLEKTLNIK